VDQIRADLQARLRAEWRRPDLRVGELEAVAEGHSGFTYWVDIEDAERGGRHVLRLSPPGARPAGPADVARQGRIMQALHEAGMPTPSIPALSAEPVVDGRPFVLMARVEGERIETSAPVQDHRALATAAVETLKRLQSLPVGATGIGDEEPMSLRGELWRWGWLWPSRCPPSGRRPSSTPTTTWATCSSGGPRSPPCSTGRSPRSASR
jgi:aminoglycoside phosphotransferase (APT) family kinase protein